VVVVEGEEMTVFALDDDPFHLDGRSDIVEDNHESLRLLLLSLLLDTSSAWL